MGYNYECRFKKHYKLEKVWIMSVPDIVEITGLDFEELNTIFLTTLTKTKSRSAAINEVCGYAMKKLFPHIKTEQEDK